MHISLVIINLVTYTHDIERDVTNPKLLRPFTNNRKILYWTNYEKY